MPISATVGYIDPQVLRPLKVVVKRQRLAGRYRPLERHLPFKFIKLPRPGPDFSPRGAQPLLRKPSDHRPGVAGAWGGVAWPGTGDFAVAFSSINRELYRGYYWWVYRRRTPGAQPGGGIIHDPVDLENHRHGGRPAAAGMSKTGHAFIRPGALEISALY